MSLPGRTVVGEPGASVLAKVALLLLGRNVFLAVRRQDGPARSVGPAPENRIGFLGRQNARLGDDQAHGIGVTILVPTAKFGQRPAFGGIRRFDFAGQDGWKLFLRAQKVLAALAPP